VGCTVVTEGGEKVGVVTQVTSARTDIFTLDCNGKTMRFPFLKDLLVSVDIEGKIITVKEQRLKEISCYED
jgi:ribosomal 30S subunit maturation factor RimM